MQKEIILCGQKISFTLKKSGGRYLRLQVKPGGFLEVFKPGLMPMFLVNNFLKSKESWILEKIEKSSRPPLQGEVKNKSSKKEERKMYLEKKEEARIIVKEKLEFWKKEYKEKFDTDLIYKNVSIKNSKTRWGSCSSKKNLNFSYKIHSLPERAQDYLIIHELCHLVHMNHSKSFWKLVELGCEDWKEQKAILKTHSLNY